MKKILKTIGCIIATIFFGITAIFVFRKDRNTDYETEKAKEKKRDELEKKSADDIAADSPNNDTIRTNIEKEQNDFRERIRNRLNQNIQGNGSSGNN